MEEVVKYRYNVMNIKSIDAFLNIRGGYNHNFRDVYFVRALGECQNYEKIIYEAEQKIGNDRNGNKAKYLRIDQLPKLQYSEDVIDYTTIYDNWKSKGKLVLKNIKASEGMIEVVSNAILKIADTYKEERHASESMIRNFISKVLFWFDMVVDSCVEDWSERDIIKIVAENVVKEQEYLFYFFLTNIGCDVLLLENKSDIIVSERLKKLSSTFQLGDYGTSILEKYKRKISVSSEKKDSKETDKIIPSRNNIDRDRQGKGNKIKIIIPERRKKKSQSTKETDLIVSQNTRMQSVSSMPSVNGSQQEKTFEELAQLASSIVMIAVHKQDGTIYGTGSGIMIGVEGYILTNYHVVAKGHFFSVRIENEEEIYYTNEVLKYHTNLDLAIIRIQKKLHPLRIYNGSKNLVRGQRVVAIGSPLGLFNSVSDGIISGFRTLRDVAVIQFTAPVSSGSSGGAVLNMFGELIGISTAGMTDGQNINLAVSYENILLFTRGFTNG